MPPAGFGRDKLAPTSSHRRCAKFIKGENNDIRIFVYLRVGN